jgi:hypothetical protein
MTAGIRMKIYEQTSKSETYVREIMFPNDFKLPILTIAYRYRRNTTTICSTSETFSLA